MLDFLKSFFNPAPPSGTTAKERLRLVLLSDHLSLAPDVVASLKRDLLEVISRYVEIDPAHADVTFEQRETEVAMLANIPITGVRERRHTSPSANVAPQPEPQPEEAALPIAFVSHDEAAIDSGVLQSTSAKPARRRRRRKKANASNGQSAVANKLATGSA